LAASKKVNILVSLKKTYKFYTTFFQTASNINKWNQAQEQLTTIEPKTAPSVMSFG
jgi:hypothetical protein